MEVGRTEVDFDEFEKLLGEIPNATSGNPHSEEAAPKSVSLNDCLAPICVNSYKGPLTEKLQSNAGFDERTRLINKTQGSPIKRVQSEEANLPDVQSLTSAFADLSFNSSSVSANFKSSPNHAVSLDCKLTSSMKNLVPSINSSVTGAPSFQLPNSMPCDFDGLNVTKIVQESSNLLKLNSQEPKQMPIGYCQPQTIENFSTALPLAHRVQGYQFLSNVAVPGVEFPLMPEQRQYFADMQSVLPCIHSQQLNQPHISWKNIEEQFYRMHQQYLYLQQLRNQRLETQHPVQGIGNVATKLVNRNVRQPYFELDHLSSWNLSADIADLKSANLRPQPQKYNSVDEVTGRVYLMAKDQHGCRFLQRKFSEGTPQDVEKIFLEVIDHIVELMTDPFGNYLVQKLIEVCNEDQRMQILCAITRKAGELVRISCDMHGTRAVQKVIENLKTPEQFCMVVSLKPGVVTLIKNMNGNHVAQRCLQYLTPEYSEFLFEAATANSVELATDRHGCCVLQKCLSHSEGEQRRRLICEITSNALILSQDPFGNYVVQFVFELRLPWATADILDQLEGNYGDLSMQKYSSNVVEKCLKSASEDRRTRIIQELINNARLDQVMQDPYGNYVIQAALHRSKGALHAALVEAIRPHVPVLRTSPYGKKVLSSNSLKK
ncbi:hypothetical protein GH714_013736 [Hevea brasiliensis]|uniref:PUM-HD domain-containing protein n=1 Tax=Hevea brasiliensis TaxID=3981 RepID=A0A6A6KEG3_HEVBR|nr:hypothetical protein GH714_013736 [Hevea brasiliensis]